MRTSREGLQYALLANTLLLRIASAASLRVLKSLTAHRYLSNRVAITCVDFYIFIAFIAKIAILFLFCLYFCAWIYNNSH